MKTILKTLFLIRILLFIFRLAAIASPENATPFAYQIESNGDVVIHDGYLEIARAFPWIFTGK
jgi:hypothetical protein